MILSSHFIFFLQEEGRSSRPEAGGQGRRRRDLLLPSRDQKEEPQRQFGRLSRNGALCEGVLEAGHVGGRRAEEEAARQEPPRLHPPGGHAEGELERGVWELTCRDR